MKANSLSDEIVVLSGRSNREFALAVCKDLNLRLGGLNVVRFSDGEIYVEIEENVRGRDVFLIQSTSNPCNDYLMELLITLDALKRASAGRVTAVMPYFGYARQDRKTKPRVPITAKLVADLLTTAGASRVLTLELHAGQMMGFFDIPVDNLNALPVVIPEIEKSYKDRNLTVVSPDAGGVERARNFARKLNDAPIAIIDKRRPLANQVAEMRVVGDVRERTCILVDDIVDTGGTISKAAQTLVDEGAKEVVAFCTHGVLSGEAAKVIAGSKLTELIITNSIALSDVLRKTIGIKLRELSVARLFSEAIRRIHSEDSISTLFT
ncbi:MAG TPA: ribose-phosphate pyrophosphokinase [Oligoflexia bacterium]|nr:ribose-phosphate pyrophosphokinase [Oligoflexia bacterium]HMP26744.1 ribose-phosphate pyrophosphokinase [Oligoflexia bacterium]